MENIKSGNDEEKSVRKILNTPAKDLKKVGTVIKAKKTSKTDAEKKAIIKRHKTIMAIKTERRKKRTEEKIPLVRSKEAQLVVDEYTKKDYFDEIRGAKEAGDLEEVEKIKKQIEIDYTKREKQKEKLPEIVEPKKELPRFEQPKLSLWKKFKRFLNS